MFCYKIHESGGMRILAIADKDAVGKKVMHKGVEISVEKDFYFERESSRKEILRIVKKFIRGNSHINAIGNEIVQLLVKEKIVDEDSVVDLSGVKHVQIYSMD